MNNSIKNKNQYKNLTKAFQRYRKLKFNLIIMLIINCNFVTKPHYLLPPSPFTIYFMTTFSTNKLTLSLHLIIMYMKFAQKLIKVFVLFSVHLLHFIIHQLYLTKLECYEIKQYGQHWSCKNIYQLTTIFFYELSTARCND